MKTPNKTKSMSKIRKKTKKQKLTKEERRVKYTQRARDMRMKKQYKDTICFQCRKRGHTVSQCPLSAAKAKGICYKCGSNQHGLQECPKLTLKEKSILKQTKDYSKIELPFAKCFTCQQMGHLSRSCPKNSNGIYVNGSGCCKICGSKDHLVAHCPNKEKTICTPAVTAAADVQEFLEEDDSEQIQEETELEKRITKSRVVTF